MAPTSGETADKDIPAGYYVNKHGTLRKKNKPASQRKEFGHHQVQLTEAELKFIRRSTVHQRQGVFAKDPTRTKARVWISPSELADLNELRKKEGRPLVNLRQNQDKNPAKMGRAETADRRRKMLEFLKLMGQSTRNERAKLDLFVTENFQVEGDGGFMNLSLFDSLELPREWLEEAGLVGAQEVMDFNV